jgi:hypothetical protein
VQVFRGLRERLFATTPGEVVRARDGSFSVTVPRDSLYVRRDWPREGSLALYPTDAVSSRHGPYVVVRFARAEVMPAADLCTSARATLHDPVARTPGYLVEELAAREEVWNGAAACELEFFVAGPADAGASAGADAFHYVGRFVSQATGYLWLGHGNPVGAGAAGEGRRRVESTRREFEAFAAGVALEPAARW